MLYLDNVPTWMALTISSIFAVVVAIFVQLIIVPWQKKKILAESLQPVKFTFGDSDGEFKLKKKNLNEIF